MLNSLINLHSTAIFREEEEVTRTHEEDEEEECQAEEEEEEGGGAGLLGQPAETCALWREKQKS